jgi:hypothetical protein
MRAFCLKKWGSFPLTKTTDGVFLIIYGEVSNKGYKEDVADFLQLVDEKLRKWNAFSSSIDLSQSGYEVYYKRVRPGESGKRYFIYEVPRGVKGLKLTF